MKKTLFFLILFLAVVAVQGKIIMKPYLQAVTTTSVYVLAECDTPDTVLVNFGPTSAYGNSAKSSIIAKTTAIPVTYVHKIMLSGLSPNQDYLYEVKQGTSQFNGPVFHTAVETGTSFRFDWMADFRTNTTIHDQIAQLVKESHPLFSLYGGDLCLNSTYKLWKDEFFLKNELDLSSGVPFFNTPGNHEGWLQNTKAFTQNPQSASGTQDYYSFDYGDLHVLCINTEIPFTEESPQYKFAASDLATTTKTWKIVFTHIPAYGAGGHGENKTLIAMTKNLFEPNHVDMVISGHSHYYQHNLVNGIHHLIIGSAGAPLYPPEKASYTLVSAKDYNYAIFDVTPSSLTMKVYNAKNKPLDSLELKKDPRK